MRAHLILSKRLWIWQQYTHQAACAFTWQQRFEREERSPGSKKRPCKCTSGLETVRHVYVRERGAFDLKSIFLRSGNITLQALESAVLSKFNSSKHVPIWKQERPESIRGGNELKSL
uniref:Uncharacterized protein n=1 Tax=Quercus lobata TaxID=97700 RepID=A0A7N2RDJ9_QUELO